MKEFEPKARAMQIHPSTKKLIDRLYDMTLERKIEWKPGPDGAVVYDTERYRVTLAGTPTEVILSSDAGVELDKADHEELTNTVLEDGTTYAEYVGQLHKEAHRIARGAESAIDDVLATLDLDGDGIPDTPAPEVLGTEELQTDLPVEIETPVTEPTVDELPEPLAIAEDLSSETVADAVQSMAAEVNGAAAADQALDEETPPVPALDPDPLPVPEVPPEPSLETIAEPEILPVPEPPTVPEAPAASTDQAARDAVLSGGSLGLGYFSGSGFANTAQRATPERPPESPLEPEVVTPDETVDPVPDIAETIMAKPADAEPQPSVYKPSLYGTTKITTEPIAPLVSPTQEAAPSPLSPPDIGMDIPALPEAVPQVPVTEAPSEPAISNPFVVPPTPGVEEDTISDIVETVTETAEDLPVPDVPQPSIPRGAGIGVSQAGDSVAGAVNQVREDLQADVKHAVEDSAESLKARSIGVIDETGEVIRTQADSLQPPSPPEPPVTESEKAPDEPPKKPPSKRFNPWR